MNVMPMLIRREFWEHRASLVIAPLVLCVIYLILCALAGANINVSVLKFGHQPPMSAAFLIVMHTVFTILLYLLMAVVAFFYLCDCLYAERKDRSILFWKSLPVSDTMTVLSKLLVALVAIPVVVYVLSFATNIVAFTIFKVLFQATPPPPNVTADWSVLGWLRVNGYLIADIFVLALWFAPVAAYQLLISAVVPRAPFVFTVLPPLTLAFGEALFFGTWNIRNFLLHRLGGVGVVPRGDGVQSVVDAINAVPLLGRTELWIGVLVAVAMIVVTIRVRRHRDDS